MLVLVLVLVVVLVLVLAALTGCVVLVVVDVDEVGSVDAALSATTPDDVGSLPVGGSVVLVAVGVSAWLSVRFGCSAELFNDVVGVADGVIVAGDADGVPGEGASPPADIRGVAGPFAAPWSGKDVGEPDSNAPTTRSAAMPKTDAAPIPFCSRLTFI